MKRTALIVSLLALAAGAVWLAARGCGAEAGDPVERLAPGIGPDARRKTQDDETPGETTNHQPPTTIH